MSLTQSASLTERTPGPARRSSVVRGCFGGQLCSVSVRPQVLVTGGAGYIGSHTCLEMIGAGYDLTVMDTMYNASHEALKRVSEITGKAIPLENVDMLDVAGMDALFAKGKFDAVIHFAGLKAVGESVAKPLLCAH